MVNACLKNAVLRAERPDFGGVCYGESEKIPRLENGECMRVCDASSGVGLMTYVRTSELIRFRYIFLRASSCLLSVCGA